MGRESKPYATMADGPDSYLFRKDGKQKLVGSADNEPEAGEEELAEDEDYQYRDEVDVEFDGNNSKIWHYGKAPGGDWETIDRSPYAQMNDFAWDLYVDFHKQNGRWPNQQESRKIEDLEYKVMTKMNEELNQLRKAAGLPIVEDCDETPGEDKNDDGDCSPFTHADENVEMVREDDYEPQTKITCPECGDFSMDLTDAYGDEFFYVCNTCGAEETDSLSRVVIGEPPAPEDLLPGGRYYEPDEFDEGLEEAGHRASPGHPDDATHTTTKLNPKWIKHFTDMGKRNLWMLYNKTEGDGEDYPGRSDELAHMEAALAKFGIGVAEGVMDEDFLVPPQDKYDNENQDAMDRFADDYAGDMADRATTGPDFEDDDDWMMQGGEDRLSSFDRDMSDSEPFEDANTKVGREFASSEFGGESGNTHVGRKFASGEIEEQGPGDDDFDADPDAMVDVGDDEDYEEFDFEDEFNAMMGNTTRFESVEEQVVAMNEIRKAAGLDPIAEGEIGDEKWEEKECDSCHGAGCGACDDHGYVDQEIEEALEEGDGDKCIRCRKGTMERGETFFGPAERCNHCNYQRQLSESAPHGGGDYDFIDFNDDKAYFLVADEIGDRIIFGMNNEVGIPEQYTDGMIDLLRQHGFEKGIDFNFTMRTPGHISNNPPEVEEDLQNGYGEHEYADSYDDYFPRGSHQSPSNDLGPTASGYGDNAMQNKMRSKETDRVYEGMRQKYRRYRLS